MARLAEKSEQLEKLVDELMKDQPSKTKVKKLMSECGMVYNKDYFSQISTVLENLSNPDFLKEKQSL